MRKSVFTVAGVYLLVVFLGDKIEQPLHELWMSILLIEEKTIKTLIEKTGNNLVLFYKKGRFCKYGQFHMIQLWLFFNIQCKINTFYDNVHEQTRLLLHKSIRYVHFASIAYLYGGKRTSYALLSWFIPQRQHSIFTV